MRRNLHNRHENRLELLSFRGQVRHTAAGRLFFVANRETSWGLAFNVLRAEPDTPADE